MNSVVLGIHALVAENAADLIHTVHAAHDEPLQRQLRGDAHVHINVQRVVMGDEGPGGGAAGDGVQNGGLHFHVAHVVQIVPHELDELRTDNEVLLHLGVHHQVHIALTEPQFLILQAVELLRQGQEGLGQQDNVVRPDAHLAPLGAERLALDAHDVADVELLELLIDLFVHLVLTGVELDAAVPVLQIAERYLTHAALAHEAACHLDGLALHRVEVVLDLLGGRIPVKAGDHKGVLALRLEIRQLLPANTGLLGQAQLRLGLGILLFSHASFSLAFDLLDSVTDVAEGRFHHDLLAFLGAQERLAEGRLLGDDAVHGIGLLRADDLIAGFLAIGALNGDGAADGDGVRRGGLIHDDHMLQDHFQLGNAGIELALLVLCLIILAVFAEVAEAAGDLDLLRHLVGPGGLQIIQFLLQLVLASLAHFVFFFHFGCSFHYPEVYNTPNLPWFYIVIGIFRIVKGKRP